MTKESHSQVDGTVVVPRRVFRWFDYLIYVPLTVVNVSAVSWALHAWFTGAARSTWKLTFWSFTFILLYTFSIQLFRWALLPLMTRPQPMPIRTARRVGVATTFVPAFESIVMLEKTVEALVAMRVPHDTWVLDEGDDPDVRAMCERLGAHHFTRKGKPAYQTGAGPYERKTKHGNYNAWFDSEAYARYDVIVGFDPDHVPDAAFLEASLGYLEDPRIGYVQLPQVYYNDRGAGFIARGAAEETYAYYSSVQMSTYSFGFPIVTGCHHVHRTTALKQVGGFAAHDADDLLITLHYRAAKWQGVYVPEIHAKGLTPTNWQDYLRQQLRWARSVLDVKLRVFPKIAGKIPLVTRTMTFLHGFYYVQEGILGLISILLLLFMLATGTPPFLTEAAILKLATAGLTLALVDFYRQRFFLNPKHEWGVLLRASFLRFVKWPYILFGLIDAITGAKRPYSLTGKSATALTGGLVMTWPHLVVAIAIMVATLVGYLLHGRPDTALLLFAGQSLFLSLLAVWTETRRPPPAFDAALLAEKLHQW